MAAAVLLTAVRVNVTVSLTFYPGRSPWYRPDTGYEIGMGQVKQTRGHITILWERGGEVTVNYVQKYLVSLCVEDDKMLCTELFIHVLFSCEMQPSYNKSGGFYLQVFDQCCISHMVDSCQALALTPTLTLTLTFADDGRLWTSF